MHIQTGDNVHGQLMLRQASYEVNCMIKIINIDTDVFAYHCIKITLYGVGM